MEGKEPTLLTTLPVAPKEVARVLGGGGGVGARAGMVQETSLSGPYLGKHLSIGDPHPHPTHGARSSERRNCRDRSPPSPSPSGPRRSALAPELGGGGGRGRERVPRVPSSGSRRPLRGLDRVSGLRAPTGRGARCPVPARPAGPQTQPLTHRSPPRCLSWRSPRSP